VSTLGWKLVLCLFGDTRGRVEGKIYCMKGDKEEGGRSGREIEV
jgi:hypothetical protein